MNVSMLLIEPTQAHKALMAAWGQCKAELMAGHRLTATFARYEEPGPTDKQRAYYHGVILKEITLFGRVNGEAFSFKAWKEHFRRTHLKDKRVRHKNPLTGRWIYERRRVSTEDLSVKKYNVLIEKVTAFAVTELGITFSAPRWETWDGREVDPDTGEIILREGETA